LNQHAHVRPSAAAFAIILAVLLAQVVAVGACGLFTRHFWLDEVHTYLTVADPDLGHALAGLRGTVNGAPPEYFLLLRAFSRTLGGPSEWTFRGFSFVMATLALWGVYSLLRRSCAPLPAMTATMAALANPVLLRQAFEARYYALWLAAVAWFAWFLSCERDGGSRRSRIMLAVCGALACTAHYFGIAAVALIILGTLIFDRRTFSLRPGFLLALAAGPIALTLRLPYYFSQKAALAHADHIPALNPAQVVRVLSELLPPPHIPLLLLAVLISRLAWQRRAGGGAAGPTDPRALAGLSTLAALPLVLMAFSAIVQPTFVSRYALPAVAGFAGLFALLISRTARPVTWALLLLFVGMSSYGLLVFRRSAARKDLATDNLIASVRALPGDAPVLFEISRDLSVITHYAPDLAARCFFLDFEEYELGGIDKFRLSVRDMARITERWYGTPALVPWTRAAQLPVFYLGVGHRPETDLAGVERDYPGFTPSPAAPGLLLLSRMTKE